MLKKICFMLIICFNVFSFAGCSDSAVSDTLNKTQDILETDTEDNKYIQLVQNGSNEDYPTITYKDAFEDFFSEPKWRYFQGVRDESKEDDENYISIEKGDDKAKSDELIDVVEFTGKCMYAKVEVEAKLQFEVDLKKQAFSAGALSFNDVPQTLLIETSLLDEVFSSYAEDHEIDDSDTQVSEEEEKPEESDYQDDDEGDTYIEDDLPGDPPDDMTGYIFPDSDSRYIKKKELKGLSQEECRIARNEIYARHGRKFTDASLQAYFDDQDWYVGWIEPDEFDESELNRYEKKNASTIMSYETSMGYR